MWATIIRGGLCPERFLPIAKHFQVQPPQACSAAQKLRGESCLPEDSCVRDLWLREAEATPRSCAVRLAAAPGEGKAGPPGGTQHLLQCVEPLAPDWVRPRQVVQLHACAQVPSAAACLVPASLFNILNNSLFRSARGSTSVSTLMSWLGWGKPHSWAEDSLG